MRIACQLGFDGLVAIESAPYLRPSEKEALFRRKAVDRCRASLRGERPLERDVSDLESAQVSDVLAERQLAVDVRGGVDDGVRVELRHDFVGFGLVLRRVFCSPPIAKI